MRAFDEREFRGMVDKLDEQFRRWSVRVVRERGLLMTSAPLRSAANERFGRAHDAQASGGKMANELS
jgi:hypothetical protein